MPVPPHVGQTPRAVAGRARPVGGGVPGPRAAAFVAGHGLGDLELLRHARGDLLQRQLHLDPDIRPAVHATAAPCGRGAEPAPEVSAEDVAELREDVLHREAASEPSEASGSAARSAVHAGVAELVVTGALVGIRQHVVGLRGLLEFLLGLLVPGVLVGVVLDGRLAVCLLYFVSVSVFLDAQHFVVIPLLCHDSTLLQRLWRSEAPARPACSPSERRR